MKKMILFALIMISVPVLNATEGYVLPEEYRDDFDLDANYDYCFKLHRTFQKAKKAHNSCEPLYKEFIFTPNPNFEKCMRLRLMTRKGGANPVKKCMELVDRFDFVDNPDFDRCFKARRMSGKTARAAINYCTEN